MSSRKRITIKVTPYQAACLAEGAGHAALFVDMPKRQEQATERAAEIVEKALEEAGEPWPL